MLRIFIVIIFIFNLSGCGYNDIQTYDEQVNASWSEVLNQYQRRADLIPNLVASIKGYSSHERDVLEAGNDSNLLIVFYVQIMPDDFVMQLHRF